MEHVKMVDPELARLAAKEGARIEHTINLIAAENHSPRAIMEIVGSIFNTKTIEGYPGNRFHAGCEVVDEIERLAIQRAKDLFGASYANVQPHSGTSANLAVYFSVLNVGDRILAMSLPHGGHLSHGHKASITSKCFDFGHYTVDPESELIDYDQVRDMALKFKPKMIVAGASSYPRLIDYARMASIAREVSAYLMADIAHLAGLVAAEAIPSPVSHCDFVTFTCYKTLMGGRGGVILATDEFAKKLDRAVFPGGQGTSAVNFIAAKALIFKLAKTPQFALMQRDTIAHAVTLSRHLAEKGFRIVTGGTENHQVLVDLEGRQLSGAQAEKVLESVGLVLNRNVVSHDALHPGSVSGLRLGTGAVTARGMGEPEIGQIADWIDQALTRPEHRATTDRIREEVKALCARFPVYAKGHDPLSGRRIDGVRSV